MAKKKKPSMDNLLDIITTTTYDEYVTGLTVKERKEFNDKYYEELKDELFLVLTSKILKAIGGKQNIKEVYVNEETGQIIIDLHVPVKKESKDGNI